MAPVEPLVRIRLRQRMRYGSRLSLTVRTRAPLSSGKVTIEISHRSMAETLRMRVFGSTRAEAVRKPIERPSTAPAFTSACNSRARATSGMSLPRANRPRESSGARARCPPARPDRAGTASGCGGCRAGGACRGTRPASPCRARRRFAEQRGIAFDSAVGIDGGARAEQVRRVVSWGASMMTHLLWWARCGDEMPGAPQSAALVFAPSGPRAPGLPGSRPFMRKSGKPDLRRERAQQR